MVGAQGEILMTLVSCITKSLGDDLQNPMRFVLGIANGCKGINGQVVELEEEYHGDCQLG